MTSTKLVAKKAVKKVTKKRTVKKAIVKPVLNRDPDTFYITMLANGEVLTTENYDLVKGLNEIFPRVLKTNVTIKVEKDGKFSENFMLLLKAKLMFRSRIGVVVFANRLILK